MRCPTCGTIGIEGSLCTVCGNRLPIQMIPGGTPASQPQIPRAKPGTLGAFFANTAPTPFAPSQQPPNSPSPNWSQFPTAPQQQQGWGQGLKSPPQQQDWTQGPTAPQQQQGWAQAPTGPQQRDWSQGPTAAPQRQPQQGSPFPVSAVPGYPGAQQAPLPYAPLAPQPSVLGAPQAQPKATTPDVVGAYNDGAGPGRLAINVALVFVVLALVGVPILFGLQHLNFSGPKTSPTFITATRVPTAVPPTGMAAFLGTNLSIAYPSAWTHHHQTQATTYGNAQVDAYAQDAGTYVDIFTLSSIPSDLLEKGIDSVGGTAVSGAVPLPITTNQRVTYNSVQWTEDDFTMSLVVGDQEVPEQMRVLGTNQGLNTFVVVLVAPRSSFDATNTTTFEPMLQSLRLG